MQYYFTNYHTSTCFDTHFILRELLINALASYKSIPNAAVGNYLVLPTAAFEILV